MRSKTQAIFLIILSAFCFALMNLLVHLAGDLPTIQKSFFRNFIAFLLAFWVTWHTSEKLQFQRRNLPFFILRSSFGTIGILCNFYAVDHLVLSDASLLNKLSPFFAIFLSFLILHEKIRPFQLFAVLIAFIGALLVIKPGFSMQFFPALIGAFGGFCAGMAYTLVRKLSQRGERGPFIVFFFSGFSCLVALPFLLLDFHPMTLPQLLLLVLAGLAAAGGQFSITAAYSLAPAGSVSVYDYTQVPFSALLGFVFFQQIPDFWSILGYVIICTVAVVMFHYQRHFLKQQ